MKEIIKNLLSKLESAVDKLVLFIDLFNKLTQEQIEDFLKKIEG